jgi:hypothetical protein
MLDIAENYLLHPQKQFHLFLSIPFYPLLPQTIDHQQL